MMDASLDSAIEDALKAQDFALTLRLYAKFFSKGEVKQIAKQHKINAANLARKNLYDALIPVVKDLKNIRTAVETLVGLKPFNYSNASQRPNFFYVPDLEAKPFWQLSDIPGLEDLCADVKAFMEENVHQQQHIQPYISDTDIVPNSEDWTTLKSAWHQTVLLKGGDLKVDKDSDFYPLGQHLLNSELVAKCPPHAPEAFFSELSPGAYIPPHFGISNLKLTVHVPVQVNPESYIHVGDETRYWSREPAGLIFDDSFRHEAANKGSQRRVVFIFDVWHPGLNSEERACLGKVMGIHREWNDNFGHLAALDHNLQSL